MRRFFARFLNLFRRGGAEHEMTREMESHLAILQEQFEQRGLSPALAKIAARREYGGVEQAKELHREERSFMWIEHLFKDVQYGWRNLRHTPGFTAVAVITLALGIGANTAIFSVVNAVLLNPLAYKDADRLVTLLHDGTDPVSAANYLDWREQNRTFEGMGAAEAWSSNLTGTDLPEHLSGIRMTQDLLPMLGVQPLLGRVFAVGEDRTGADHEVILSHGLWKRRFNEDRNVVGKAIRLNGESYTVVGVMPATFKFAPFWQTHAELWAPLAFGDYIHERGRNSLRVFGRLKPGVTLAQARADIAAITARLEQQYPGTNRRILVTPLKENVVGKIATPLLMVLGAVGFVLLIACANVAHMLLARTSDREREIAVRTALGAGKTRVVRQFLTENLLLAVLGGLAGLMLAAWGTRALVALSPAYIPRVELVGIDGRVVLFLFAVTAFTTVVFGLVPAIHAAAGNLTDALKEGGRAGSDGAGRSGLRGFLVASEFALAFMLLIGAGLMVRSFFALQSVQPGFNPNGVLSMVVSVAGAKEAEANRRAIFYPALLEKIRALPGVRAAGAINHLPLAGDMWGLSFRVEGQPVANPGESPRAVYRLVMPGYFETMRLPLLSGRDVTKNDDGRASEVVIINQRAARQYWPGQDPIGKRITFDTGKVDKPEWLTVIGVVADAKQLEWTAEPSPEVYVAALQNDGFMQDGSPHMAYITLVVRTGGNPADMASAVKQTIWSFDRNLPVSEVLTMDQVVADANAQPRFELLLLGVFAAVALVLAAVGIYGVMNYSVSRRTREIGIRISLGAGRGDVLRMVVQQGMRQALTGTFVGVAGALLLSQAMEKMLYGVKATDPATFGGVALVLISAAVLATCIPARKATQIEPAVALRSE